MTDKEKKKKKKNKPEDELKIHLDPMEWGEKKDEDESKKRS